MMKSQNSKCLYNRNNDWNWVSSEENEADDQHKDFANFSKHKKQSSQ